ncbi:MAG: hypothetical protein WC139_02600 [Candidatus Kapaibacterium sp.]
MKPFIAIVIIINTIFFGAMAYYSKLTYELTEIQTIVVKAGMDTTNIRLRQINTALDDKLFGIMHNIANPNTGK